MSRSLTASLLLAAALAWIAPLATAHAEPLGLAIGPHGGINLDEGNPHLGGDVLVPITQLTPSLQLAIWPSYAHVFIEDGHDVELLGVDVPFIFEIDESIVSPYLAPGLGLAFYGDTTLKLNLIGGLFLDTGSSVRPFAELAIRLIRGTFVDLLVGVLFEL